MILQRKDYFTLNISALYELCMSMDLLVDPKFLDFSLSVLSFEEFNNWILFSWCSSFVSDCLNFYWSNVIHNGSESTYDSLLYSHRSVLNV